ncbi:protein of unknown function [Caballeronia sp. S22]
MWFFVSATHRLSRWALQSLRNLYFFEYCIKTQPLVSVEVQLRLNPHNVRPTRSIAKTYLFPLTTALSITAISGRS